MKFKIDKRTRFVMGFIAGCILYATMRPYFVTEPLISPLSDFQPMSEEEIVKDYKEMMNPSWMYEVWPQSISGIPAFAQPCPTPTEVRGQVWKGTASWYSRDGCIGCSANLHMANGKPLDDNALTVAFNKLPLGRKVRVTNAESRMTVIAVVTDTGGFERHGRIIDITPKVRDSINCGGLCEVEVVEILE